MMVQTLPPVILVKSAIYLLRIRNISDFSVGHQIAHLKKSPLLFDANCLASSLNRVNI